jgi:type I restriction enzyme S subunit
LTDLRQNLLNRDGVYVPQNSYDYLSKSSLFGGEFLLANVGAYAGLVWEMPKVRYRCTLGPNMFLAKFKPECADNVFMIYSASYSFIRQQLDAMASASAQPKLNKTDFRNVIQILPKLNEQKKIVEILESQDMQIISEQKYRDKLKLQKKGLMHDLLTGKVRIKT